MPQGAYGQSLDSPAGGAFAISPSDTVDLTIATRGIWVGDVGAGGAVKVTTEGGDTVTFSGCTAGTVIPVRARRVFLTGTSAASLIGLY